MGAGYHGGFGKTAGSNERYRIGKIVEPTPKTYEMALDPVRYAEAVAQKYHIHLKGAGQTVQIVFNPKLGMGQYGRTRKEAPNVIEIGPSALYSEKQLANTLAHELNHVRSFLRGGNAPEDTAYHAGDTLQEYIEGVK